MKRRRQRAGLILTAAFAGLAATSLHAADIYWKGGTGGFFDANYTTNGTDTVFPTLGSDIVNIGAGGSVTLSDPDVNPYSFQKLRVGINGSTNIPLPAGVPGGTGNLTVSGGARIDLTAGASGNPDAGLWVGRATNGTLTIDGAGSSVTSNRLVVVGYAIGGQVGQSGTIHVKNGGELIVTLGNINMGAGSTGSAPPANPLANGGNGMQGHIILDGGAVRMLDASADLIIGVRRARSSVVMSDGEFIVGDAVEIGTLDNSGTGNQAGSSLSVSGGTFTSGGDMFVGRDGSNDAALNISGTGYVTIGTKTVGPNPAANYSLTVGHDESVDATANISGGTLDVKWNFFVGRNTSQNATVNLTNGTVNIDRFLLLGNNGSTNATFNHSGGVLNLTTHDFRVGDTGTTTATYNLSGTGEVYTMTGGIVGRQGTASFIQTGGTAILGDALSIGKRETGTNATNGLYKISGGVLEAGAFVSGMALDVAPNGTGEFRVVGDDATINLHGNLLVNSTANGVGTLAFELESGDLLSMINVDNSATLSAGSRLVFDASNALPTQTTYDLLTAQSISVDPSVVFEGPAGWSYQVVGGGSGQILQATGPLIAADDADFDGDGDVDGADFLTWQRNVATANPTLAQGNANGDNVVDGADLAIWEGQFGSATTAAASVPEPGSLALLAAAACLVGACGVRRAKRGA